MKQVIVTIPVYKEHPSIAEVASFKQGLTTLRNYDICIFTHKGCNLGEYRKLSDEVGKTYSVQYFDANYFKSVQGYNDLCFSALFYERFSDYEFMFIYQLDAWVFRDELEYWCNKGYDYIGAPIFHAYNSKHFTNHFAGIGNGGLCLRRISHCLTIVKGDRNKPLIKPYPLFVLYYYLGRYNDKFTKNWINRLRIIPTVIAKIFGKYNTIDYYQKNHINEDMIFGTWSTKSWGYQGNIPSMEEAMHFSLEVHPEDLYHKMGDKLPFGCHAFEKWEYDSFWSNHIKIN